MSDRSRLPDDGRRRSHGGGSEVLDASAPEEYRVGPGRPPKQFQWKPGQSGNPQGRKRTSASIVPDLKAVLERALGKKVTLRQGERERTVTMATAGIEQLVAQFAKGDRYARRDILDLAHRLGVDLMAGRDSNARDAEIDVSAEDEVLLADYLRRHAAGAIVNKRRSSSARKIGVSEARRKKHDPGG
jgi:Family of unknown function (DUF5681)